MSHQRRWVAAAFAAAALVLGSFASPAVGETTRTTVSGTVLDEFGQPLRGVQVYVTKTGPNLTFVGTTLSDGTYETDRHITLPTGSQQVVYVDPGEEYVAVTRPATIQSGPNPLPSVQLTPGMSVAGTVTAPSGRPLRDLDVVVARNNTDPLDFDYVQATTTINGRFGAGAIGAGTFHAYVSADKYHASRATVEVPAREYANEGVAPVQLTLTNVRVPAKVSLTGAFTGPRSVKLNTQVVGTYGISTLGSGAKVTLYDGSRAIKKNVALTSGGKATFSVSKLTSGTHSFRVKFLGTQDVVPTLGATLKGRVR